MARNFTVTQLVARVRERADYENDDHVDDTEIIKDISESYSWLYDLLAGKGLNYFRSTQSITGTGVTPVALPSDYRSTIGVVYNNGAGYKQKLKKVGWAEAMSYSTNAQAVAEAYDIVGGYVELYPPPSGGSYTHYYVPAPADLTSGSTNVDGVSGWEELMIVDCAIKIRSKADMPTTALERRFAALMERVEQAAEQRSMGEPAHVYDLEGELGDVTEERGQGGYGYY